VALAWQQRSIDRWIGFDDAGREVGFVALTVADAGDARYWFAWRRDGTPNGKVVGEFDSAETAIVAVDES
jgi:hypothetical protein